MARQVSLVRLRLRCCRWRSIRARKIWARHVLRPIYPAVKTVIPGFFELRYCGEPGLGVRPVPRRARRALPPVRRRHRARSSSSPATCARRRPGRAGSAPSWACSPAARSATSSTASPIGRVTDFIVWRVGAHEWPTFNIADAALVVGVIGLLFDMRPEDGPRRSERHRHRRRYVVFVVSAAARARASISSPRSGRATRCLPIYPRVKTVIPGYFEFRYSENPGAAFGLLRDVPGARCRLRRRRARHRSRRVRLPRARRRCAARCASPPSSASSSAARSATPSTASSTATSPTSSSGRSARTSGTPSTSPTRRWSSASSASSSTAEPPQAA